MENLNSPVNTKENTFTIENLPTKITTGLDGFTDELYYTLGKSKTNSTQLFSQNAGRKNTS